MPLTPAVTYTYPYPHQSPQSFSFAYSHYNNCYRSKDTFSISLVCNVTIAKVYYVYHHEKSPAGFCPCRVLFIYYLTAILFCKSFIKANSFLANLFNNAEYLFILGIRTFANLSLSARYFTKQ